VGAAIARRMADQYHIILHYHRSVDETEKLAVELRVQGAGVTLWQQDLCAPDLAQNFQELMRRTRPIDILVNNAAVFYPDRDRVGEVTPELYQEIMMVNCWAPFCLMQEFAKQADEQTSACTGPRIRHSRSRGADEGNIINILDQRVLNISHAFPVYTASKSALWALTKNMALALAPRIRVNAIAPGHVLPSVGESENTFRVRQMKTPLGIGPTPEAIAETISMILNSPSMTGACIPLDGGEHLVAKRK